ncbi:hypothetical protein RHSIM_Rhsim11G0124000 [Rhododendron simsii]|uniref:Serpin domain-containing protein n=1 Tax=Rhododendron simsii TaxID=118357 RepID=A0A834L851_RHOSS|nr:hypothetical protein RHSIM_Rhsim11G0124000 [Rhododendron simsii]
MAASGEKKEGSPESTIRQPKWQKGSTENLPLVPNNPTIPNPKITRSRMDFAAGMAKQLLLNQVKKRSYNNFALSPTSIDVVLGMVAAGSRGPTLERILALLGAQDIDEIKQSASAMMTAAAHCGGDGPVLCMVNGAWVDKRFPLVESYKEEILKGIYNCDTQTVDFLYQANEVVNNVNSWVENASKGLITILLEPDSISPDTAIILANGLYFKGIWTSEHEFDASLTKKRNFYLLTGDTISIPFMTSCDAYHYGSFDSFKVLKIPYEGAELDRKFSMYFFLPHGKGGLQNLLEELCSNSGSLNQDFFNLKEVYLNKFWIPKFAFSYEFTVSETMKETEMTFPFIESPEDFSEMMTIPKGIQFVSTQMFQKVVIKVDEKGTEAEVITEICAMKSTGGCCSPPKSSFVADHPFIFMVKEEISGLIFFMGAVLNPGL